MSTSQNGSTTIDPIEVKHFDDLSSIWWDKKSSARIVHSFNKIRVPFIVDGLISTGVVRKELVGSAKPLEGLLILDVGCGTGVASETLYKLGCTVVGIDVSPKMIEAAKEHVALHPSLSNIEYLLETPEDHVKRNYEKYDAVVATEVLDHVANPDLFLEACVKCLKPGGSIFITTVNKTRVAWLAVIVFVEYIWRLIPIGSHSYDKFVSVEDTQKMLEEYNCKTKEVRGFLYNLFTDTWHWVWTTAIHYALHAVKN